MNSGVDERDILESDRSVVESLKQQGDPLSEARRVDHWIYFKQEGDCNDFETAVKAVGFAIESKRGEDDGSYAIRVHREDFVDLQRIHATVMELVKLAEANGGDYDGWETEVLQARV